MNLDLVLKKKQNKIKQTNTRKKLRQNDTSCKSHANSHEYVTLLYIGSSPPFFLLIRPFSFAFCITFSTKVAYKNILREGVVMKLVRRLHFYESANLSVCMSSLIDFANT